MMPFAYLSLLWFCAIGCAVIGGVYFTFSTFVMAALGRIDPAAGIPAMQAINRVILRSLFMPLFFATTAACAILAVLAILQWPSRDAWLALLVAGIYLAGMFGVTIVRNVPMNNALESTTRTADAEAAAVWSRYLRDWTFWNHVRTVASIAAALLCMIVLVRA